MFSKSFLCAAFASFSVAVTAYSQSSISGEVKGVDGRAARGAEVQVQRQDAKAAPVAVKTDAKGHFVLTNLPAGRYAVMASGNGASSPQQIVKLAGKSETLSLRMATAASNGASMAKKKKHMVWVPAQTGSRIGGNWVEVDDSHDSGSAEDRAALQRLQNTQSMMNQRAAASSGGSR